MKEYGFAGTLIGTGEEATDHDRVGAGCQGLHYISRELYAAIGNNGNLLLTCGPDTLHDGGYLWNTYTGNNPGRTYRAGTDTDLYPVNTRLDERLRPLIGCHIAGYELTLGETFPDRFHHVDYPLGVTVGGIDKDDIGAGLDERLHSRLPVWTGTHRGTNPQPPHPVLARVRILFPLLYILDGYEPLEIAPPVNHRELLDPVAVENLLRLLDGCAGRDRNHLPCHDLGDLLGEVIFKLQIPVGENPYELPTSYNRQPRYVPLLLDPNGVR